MSISQDSRISAQSAQNFNHISFSFDNLRNVEKEPRKTIDQYLRLKTNQSIEERINLPAKRSLCYRRSLKSEEADPDNDYHAQLKNDEQLLRMESMTKQYELKLAKQEEFFALREWKLKQEVQNLSLQISSLNEEVRRLRAAGKQQNSHCSLCSDGQVINHLTSVLRQAEENHRHCLDEKKQMTRRLDISNGKLQVLEEEHDKIYQQFKAINKQLRNSNNQNHLLEVEKSELAQSITTKQAEWQFKQATYEQSIEELQKRVAMQERKEDETIANSKITLQSTQSALTNIENNMNGSFINPRSSMQKQRNSLSKVHLKEKEDYGNSQNYNYYRKMSDYSKSSNKFQDSKCSSKIENLKWKFF